MIKDKLTPELKKKILEEIKLSGESGKERGFFLCLDQKRKLFASKTFEGIKGKLSEKEWKEHSTCPGKIQGNFHTHPGMKNFRKIGKRMGYDLSDQEIKIVAKETAREQMKDVGIKCLGTVHTPSYNDVLIGLMHKCVDVSEGTTCIGTDVDDSKIECWTPKLITAKNYSNICNKTLNKYKKLKDESDYEPWIVPLYDIETIRLK